MPMPSQYSVCWIRYMKNGGFSAPNWVANRWFFEITGTAASSANASNHLQNVGLAVVAAYRHVLPSTWDVHAFSQYGTFVPWGTITQHLTPVASGLVSGADMDRGFHALMVFENGPRSLGWAQSKPWLYMSAIPRPWVDRGLYLNATGLAAYRTFLNTMKTPMTFAGCTSHLRKLYGGQLFTPTAVLVKAELGRTRRRNKKINKAPHFTSGPGPL